MLGSRGPRTLSWLVLSLFLLLLALACKPHSKPAEESGSASNPSTENAELTRKMEEKAADIRTKEEEIRNMQAPTRRRPTPSRSWTRSGRSSSRCRTRGSRAPNRP